MNYILKTIKRHCRKLLKILNALDTGNHLENYLNGHP